jgi:aromatic-amino-acid transaminase
VNFLPPRTANRPGDDPIFALNREASERRARGDAVINATVGALLEDDGTLAVLPSVIEAQRVAPGPRAAGYSPIAGNPGYLAAVIADLLGGTPLATQAVAVATPGGTGALRHAVATFLERHQALVTSSFYWGPYATICEENERALRTFAMFDAAGRFDAAALERALDATASAQGRLLVFLNDPCHNPTGYSMGDDEWRATAEVLTAVAARVPLTVLADVAYLAYARDPSKRFLTHLAPLAERALVLFAWSASKAFTQYGARVGALIACTADAAERDAIGRALAFACRGTWSNCNTAGQLVIERCLTDDALRATVTSERERLRALLAARVEAFNAAARGTSLRYPRYDGGFFVTVFAPDAPAAAARLKARGVFVVPQAGALRVALCSVAQADVPALVAALDETLRVDETAPRSAP